MASALMPYALLWCVSAHLLLSVPLCQSSLLCCSFPEALHERSKVAEAIKAALEQPGILPAPPTFRRDGSAPSSAVSTPRISSARATPTGGPETPRAAPPAVVLLERAEAILRHVAASLPSLVDPHEEVDSSRTLAQLSAASFPGDSEGVDAAVNGGGGVSESKEDVRAVLVSSATDDSVDIQSAVADCTALSEDEVCRFRGASPVSSRS